MKLIFIEPRVASLSELHIFRCIGCGDVRAIEQKTTPHNRPPRRAKVSLTEINSVAARYA